ncbi:MAG: winged helix-turn-helix domain-containing protein, partial [Oscillospiraceae bacterium]|nr:winged helix-turn-helix domain-containing protein [Oscillospiraceae bacterium]
MNSKEQKWLVLLYALIELNGGGTKQQVLVHIQEQDYWHINDQNDVLLETRCEFKWRNDFAFERAHLVRKGYMQRGQRDIWNITKEGRNQFSLLVEKARNNKAKLITDACLKKLFEEQVLPEIAADQSLLEQIDCLDQNSDDPPIISLDKPLSKGPMLKHKGKRKVYARNAITSYNALRRAG